MKYATKTAFCLNYHKILRSKVTKFCQEWNLSIRSHLFWKQIFHSLPLFWRKKINGTKQLSSLFPPNLFLLMYRKRLFSEKLWQNYFDQLQGWLTSAKPTDLGIDSTGPIWTSGWVQGQSLWILLSQKP